MSKKFLGEITLLGLIFARINFREDLISRVRKIREIKSSRNTKFWIRENKSSRNVEIKRKKTIEKYKFRIAKI